MERKHPNGEEREKEKQQQCENLYGMLEQEMKVLLTHTEAAGFFPPSALTACSSSISPGLK